MSAVTVVTRPAGASNGTPSRGRVLVTRPSGQVEEISRLLGAAGYETVAVPSVLIEALADLGSLDEALRRIDSFQWVVFSSANAARIVGKRLAALGMGPAAWGGVGVVAGPATAGVLAEHGLLATRIPAPYSARAAMEVLETDVLEGAYVLLPRAEGGREELASGLRARGAIVEEVVVYRTVPVAESAALVRELVRGVRAVVFFSPSAVRGFGAALASGGVRAADLVGEAITACIGATTAAEARRQGLRVDVIPADTSAASLVAALGQHVRERAHGRDSAGGAGR